MFQFTPIIHHEFQHRPLSGAFRGAACFSPITYVDASTANTTLANGDPNTSTASQIDNDNRWSVRGFGNSGAVYTANDASLNPGEDAPMLRTTITGLTVGAPYDV